MLTFLRSRSLDLAQDADATLTWGGVGWGCLRSFDHVPSTLHKMLMLRSHRVGWSGVGMLTFLRPRSLDLAQDADARLTWGRMFTFLRPRSLDLAQDADATLTFMGFRMEWGGDVYVPSATFPRPCTRCWCYAHMGYRMEWGGDINVPSVTFPRPCTRCWCYAHMGWGGVGMLTFTRLCTRLWCCISGVGWDGSMILLIRPCERLWCYAQDDLIIMV